MPTAGSGEAHGNPATGPGQTARKNRLFEGTCLNKQTLENNAKNRHSALSSPSGVEDRYHNRAAKVGVEPMPTLPKMPVQHLELLP
jgi:hypothetical protein